MSALFESNRSAWQMPTSSMEQALMAAPNGTHVATWLNSHGYTTALSNLEIGFRHSQLDFSGCHFENVSFTGSLEHAHFNDCTFQNVAFNQVELKNAVFDHSTFQQSHFNQVNFNQASFVETSVNHSVLEGCDFSDSSFYRTEFNFDILVEPNLFNVLDLDNCFDQTHLVASNSSERSDYAMTEALYDPVSSKIATLDDGEWAEYAFEDLSHYGLELNTIDEDVFLDLLKPSSLPQGISLAELAHEIKAQTLSAKPYEECGQSIAQQVINAQTPNIGYFKAIAKNHVDNASSVFIPGGEDILKSFYGYCEADNAFFQMLDKKIDFSELEGIDNIEDVFYLKQFMEFVFVDEAFASNKPVMGVCHGLQLLNVYFGGTLKDVEGHNGIVPLLELHTDSGVLGSIVEQGMSGPSYHNQAIEKLGFGLEMVASYDGVIKAVQSVDAKQLIMTQFHPEYNFDSTSTKIMQSFAQMTNQYAVNSKVLELKDVLGIESNSLNSLLESGPTPTVSDDASKHDFSVLEQEISSTDPMMFFNQSLVDDLTPVANCA